MSGSLEPETSCGRGSVCLACDEHRDRTPFNREAVPNRVARGGNSLDQSVPEPATHLVENGLQQRSPLPRDELPVLYRRYHDEYGTKATRLGIWSSFFVYMLFSTTDIL